MLKSFDRDFILAEQQTLLADIAGYAKKAMTTITACGPGRIVGNAYLVLEQNHGSGAALGFMITLQLVRAWTEMQDDHGWLRSQYEELTALGHDAVGEYVIPFISNPAPEMQRLSELLTGNSLLRGFIRYGNFKLGPKFAVGAYLLIGLFLYAEQRKV